MTERQPAEPSDESGFSDLDVEWEFLSLGEILTPQLEDPEAQACLDEAREFQAALDKPGADIPESQIAIRLYSLNRQWPHHQQPVAVTGWVEPDELGFVGESPQSLDAIFGTDRLKDDTLPEPRYLVSGLNCESHGFTADYRKVLDSGSEIGRRAVMSLRFLRNLDVADSAHSRRARVLPSAQVLLKADVGGTAMEFERDTIAVSQIKAEKYFPITAKWLAELANDKALSPTQKLVNLRDHPIEDAVPHYVTGAELESLARYAESVVNVSDLNVPYIIDLVKGAVLFRPDGAVVGALVGERNGLVQVLGIAVRARQTRLDPHRIAQVKGELDYRLIVNILGGSSAGGVGLAEIRLPDIENIQTILEVAPGNILRGRGHITDIAPLKQVPLS